MEEIQKYTIIVAGGSGKRMGTELPKQFIEIHGKPILMHTLERFFEFDNLMKLIIVLPESQHFYWSGLIKKHQCTIPHQLTVGGVERFHSVKNGLQLVDGSGLVAIHDGVRPLVSLETIQHCFEAAALYASAIPVVPVTESVRWDDKTSNHAIDRGKLFLVQTPQVFSIKLLKEAYQQPFDATYTDDAGVAEKLGTEIHLVEGNPENIKITRPMDLLVAEALLI
jgi:2-C-methyl-D-erythritol 4-phosphate cytidylyltransferase